MPDYAVRRIGRLWRKVASHGELELMHGEERHELRIEVKKLRYAHRIRRTASFGRRPQAEALFQSSRNAPGNARSGSTTWSLPARSRRWWAISVSFRD
jgi:CHAD domain-containing protein